MQPMTLFVLAQGKDNLTNVTIVGAGRGVVALDQSFDSRYSCASFVA